MPSRRFPPPWSIEESHESFIVKDANGQALAYISFEDEAFRLCTADIEGHSYRIQPAGMIEFVRGSDASENYCLESSPVSCCRRDAPSFSGTQCT